MRDVLFDTAHKLKNYSQILNFSNGIPGKLPVYIAGKLLVSERGY